MGKNEIERTDQQDILVVDDSVDSLQLLKDMLGKAGYHVRVASDGALALLSVAFNPPDLILLDVKMPDMDGFEVCRRLKSDVKSRDIPVIFISGLGEISQRVQGFNVGGVDYITKPFEVEEVLARVKTQLRLRELAEKLEQKVYERTEELEREITEHKRTEEELIKYRMHLEDLVVERTKELSESNSQLTIARDAANAANEAKSRFLANMSHELRTPLNAILGYAQIIKQSTLDERQRKGVITIANSGNHLLTLISDILDLSKIEAHKLKIHPAVVHFPSFLGTIEDIIRVRAELKNLNFVFETESDLPCGVMADETRLRQVLLNLLGNAVKFTDAGQVAFWVTVLSRKEDSAGIRFEVKDTGPGIASDKLETIFAPFEQAGETASREGTGLGLAISRQLVHMMGGEICVKSEVGHGSTFCFELNLPLVEIKPPVKTIERVVTGYQSTRKKVLIIDDRPSNRSVL